MKPDFKKIDIKNPGIPSIDPKVWEREKGIENSWKTPEQIQPKYCPNSGGGQNWLKQVKKIMKEEE